MYRIYEVLYCVDVRLSKHDRPSRQRTRAKLVVSALSAEFFKPGASRPAPFENGTSEPASHETFFETVCFCLTTRRDKVNNTKKNVALFEEKDHHAECVVKTATVSYFSSALTLPSSSINMAKSRKSLWSQQVRRSVADWFLGDDFVGYLQMGFHRQGIS